MDEVPQSWQRRQFRRGCHDLLHFHFNNVFNIQTIKFRIKRSGFVLFSMGNILLVKIARVEKRLRKFVSSCTAFYHSCAGKVIVLDCCSTVRNEEAITKENSEFETVCRFFQKWLSTFDSLNFIVD